MTERMTVVDHFQEIKRRALECRFKLDTTKAGLEDSEARDMVWNSAQLIRDTAKIILHSSGDLSDADLSHQTLDKEDIASVYEFIEGVASDMVLHGTGDRYPLACTEIIVATRKVEELLEPILRVAAISGHNPAQTIFVSRNGIPASDVYTCPTGFTPHQPAFGSATTEDREAEATDLPEEVAGGDIEGQVQKLEHLLHELQRNQDIDSLQIASTLTQLGMMHLPAGDLTEAKVILENSLQVYRSFYCDQDHVCTARVLCLLGLATLVEGNLTQAKVYLEESLQMFQSLPGDTVDAVVCHVLLSLGRLALVEGGLTKAKAYSEECLRTARSLDGCNEHPLRDARDALIADTLLFLVTVHLSEADAASAKDRLEESSAILLPLLRAYGGKDHPVVAQMLYCRGWLSLQEQDLPLAKVCLEDSLRMHRSLYGDKHHPLVATSMLALGEMSLAEGDLAEAKVNFEKSLRMNLSVFGDQDHPVTAAAFLQLGRLSLEVGDHVLAQGCLEKSLQMHHSLFGDSDPPHPHITATLILFERLNL